MSCFPECILLDFIVEGRRKKEEGRRKREAGGEEENFSPISH
ncbi:hypothetical protein [Phormidium nigroviride]